MYQENDGMANIGDRQNRHEWKETAHYPEVIMDNIKRFYELTSQPKSSDRDEELVSEINKMVKMIEIFEDKEIIDKEFKELQEYLKGKKTISYDYFIELLHKIAVICQRIWYHKGLLLTPVPYKEDIYKDVLENWKKTYPKKFTEHKVKQ